jgi:ABC-type polysaccharide/polyol phosphate transport system ATPase subunit
MEQKSTLLKIIAGVLTPTSGSCATTEKYRRCLNCGAGFNPEYTGIENIYLNGTIIGFSREEMKDKLEKIINLRISAISSISSKKLFQRHVCRLAFGGVD